MKITDAVKNKKNPKIIKIFIDDAYAFSMMEEDYILQVLYEKQDISEEEVQRIKEITNVKAVKNQALRYLAKKDYTKMQLIEKLDRIGYDEETVRAVVTELKTMGYINDRMYAHKYITDRLKLKPKSRKALFLELRQKGLDEEIIGEALEDIEIDDTLLAYRAAKKRFGKYDISDKQVKRKVYSFLGHRGYDMETIAKVVRQLEES